MSLRKSRLSLEIEERLKLSLFSHNFHDIHEIAKEVGVNPNTVTRFKKLLMEACKNESLSKDENRMLQIGKIVDILRQMKKNTEDIDFKRYIDMKIIDFEKDMYAFQHSILEYS